MTTQQQQALASVQAELNIEVAQGLLPADKAAGIAKDFENALNDGSVTEDAVLDMVAGAQALRELATALGDTGEADVASDEDSSADTDGLEVDFGDDDEDQN